MVAKIGIIPVFYLSNPTLHQQFSTIGGHLFQIEIA